MSGVRVWGDAAAEVGESDSVRRPRVGMCVVGPSLGWVQMDRAAAAAAAGIGGTNWGPSATRTSVAAKARVAVVCRRGSGRGAPSIPKDGRPSLVVVQEQEHLTNMWYVTPQEAGLDQPTRGQ